MATTKPAPLRLPPSDGPPRVAVSQHHAPDEKRPETSGHDDTDAAHEDSKPQPAVVVTSSPAPPLTPLTPLTPNSPNIPIHPIPLLQEAFSESLDEATSGAITKKPKLTLLDARARREKLLAQDKEAEPYDAIWRYRPGQTQHELFKLLAQISFGVYLLLNGMANSNSQVINILQVHIDEVDEYLEVTLEDLGQAVNDLGARLDHLKMPLSDMQAFEALLEDRTFRNGILEANEKIDHILGRTDAAMKQWDDDIEAGLRCTAAFTSWLSDQTDQEWRAQRPDVAEVFDAMKGNAEGWLLALDDIQDRAQDVNNLLVRLMTLIIDMEKKAGEISRKTWTKIPPFSSPTSSHNSQTMSIRSRVSSRQSDPRFSHAHQLSASSSRPVTLLDTDACLSEFPLPPVPPLVSPSGRHSRDSSLSRQSKNQTSLRSISPVDPSSSHGGRIDSAVDESLYVLQPRIYSPRTSDQSSLARKESLLIPDPDSSKYVDNGFAHKRDPSSVSSLRQRVSHKSIMPDAIMIPPRSVTEAPIARPSSKYATPRSAAEQPFDSAYCSDTEAQSLRQASLAGSDSSLSPPTRPHIVHSPRSDHLQYYHPVLASPHSPLQQRPHTALGPRMSYFTSQQPRHFSSQQPRSQLSPLGNMSIQSSTTLSPHDPATTPTARSPGPPSSRAHSPGAATLAKKKKSTFGWFKKAFSLDEEERAQFEARRANVNVDRYYENTSPRFLDGRRIR
ncbi:hypothetical protein HIM_08985 [Hirsutella minnesotensis 3608]|uniref:Uncharacterized protein n=1 Tax=Hirsutella minnesotensis 3608 TaxID=1043627 RepID=A0A0F7ZGW3_9HYPO|nr:hypothetical protein HIM_08985 [Hirsutella minnesotensis 3608]